MEIPKYLEDCIDEFNAAVEDGTATHKLSQLMPKFQKAKKRAIIELCESGEKPNHVAKFLGVSKQLVEQALHPEAEKARKAVTHAIKSGKLTRQPCRACGDPKSEAHHEDYNKPLEVVWLCKTHHGMADSARRARLTK